MGGQVSKFTFDSWFDIGPEPTAIGIVIPTCGASLIVRLIGVNPEEGVSITETPKPLTSNPNTNQQCVGFWTRATADNSGIHRVSTTWDIQALGIFACEPQEPGLS
jgi:hypothetical protein